MTKFELNTGEFSNTIRQIILETGRGVKDVLTQETKLFVADCIKLTPPRSRKGVIGESYSAQREVGKKAVTADIHKGFKPLEFMKVAQEDNRLGAALRKYIRERNLSAVNKILKDIGADKAELIMQATEEVHREIRNANTGRVMRGKFFVVMQLASINKLLKEKLSHIGKGKAGWMKAANALGLKGIPQWISGQKSPGVFENHLSDSKPYFLVGNAVPFLQSTEREADIMRQAMNSRLVAMKAKLQRIIDAAAKKHNAR